MDRVSLCYSIAPRPARPPLPSFPEQRILPDRELNRRGPARPGRLQRHYRLAIEDGLPEVIAEDLLADAGSALAPTLQVLLTKMWERARQANPDQPRFDRSLYESLKAEGYLLKDVLDEGLKARYFRPVPGGWEIDSGLRERVRFRQGNLVEPGFLTAAPPYDLVFCRNLFIYLHPPARRQALQALERLVAADGLLCMGHAEPLEPARWRPTGPAGSFLYRRSVADALVTGRQGDKVTGRRTTSILSPCHPVALSSEEGERR